jgi:hypothetical protein
MSTVAEYIEDPITDPTQPHMVSTIAIPAYIVPVNSKSLIDTHNSKIDVPRINVSCAFIMI